MRPASALTGIALILSLAACDGREEIALDNLTNGANSAVVANDVKAEAEAALEPLVPPPPGAPGGLPDDRTPLAEEAIDPDSAQGAAQLVQSYYGLLEQRHFAEAQDLWGERSPVGIEENQRFANRFRGFSEIHANIGAPTNPEGAAGSVYVTVPVQVYGRLTHDGKPWYMLRQVTVRRVNAVDGASEADRRWHIESITRYEATTSAPADNAISATDGMPGAH
ncbi:MAG: hypothetical protein ABW039_14255 [Sphingobium sp.]